MTAREAMSAARIVRPATIDELRAAVVANLRVLARGGGTKPALSTPPSGAVGLDMGALTGVIEYEPGEFVMTALAGTPVADIARVLAEHDQYLPFDPPLVEAGATLGGTVAAGLSGPGRCRHGGVRDFVLGARFVTADGDLVRGRGRVVKNAAGFDLPRLLVGSLGRLGVIVELSLKVLPRPDAYASIRLDVPTVARAVEIVRQLGALPLDVDALDIVVLPAGARVLVRIGGLRRALAARCERIRDTMGGGEVLGGPDDEAPWRDAREFGWVPAGWSLVKVPVTPHRIVALEMALTALPVEEVRRTYSGAGQVAWVAMAEPPAVLDSRLASLGLPGLAVFGPPQPVRLGLQTGAGLERRVKQALDPVGRFGEG
jgi:glycolate oxidase FAD binding subunit